MRGKILTEIINRAKKMGLYTGIDLQADLSLMAADKTFNLRLDEFLNADDSNFVHDFRGIMNNINLDLDNFTYDFGDFVPRFASNQ